MIKVIVRPMREEDLDEADRIIRLAFGTFLGMSEPLDSTAMPIMYTRGIGLTHPQLWQRKLTAR